MNPDIRFDIGMRHATASRTRPAKSTKYKISICLDPAFYTPRYYMFHALR